MDFAGHLEARLLLRSLVAGVVRFLDVRRQPRTLFDYCSADDTVRQAFIHGACVLRLKLAQLRERQPTLVTQLRQMLQMYSNAVTETTKARSGMTTRQCQNLQHARIDWRKHFGRIECELNVHVHGRNFPWQQLACNCVADFIQAKARFENGNYQQMHAFGIQSVAVPIIWVYANHVPRELLVIRPARFVQPFHD